MAVKIQVQDKRLFVDNPKDFNPARNKAVIEETIRETTKFFQGLEDAVDDGLKERIDILNSYGRYKFNMSGGKSFEDWAGRALTRQVIGEKLIQKVKALKSVDKLKGKFKNHILT